MPKSLRRRPSLDALESRHLCATVGLPGPAPQLLTLGLAYAVQAGPTPVDPTFGPVSSPLSPPASGAAPSSPYVVVLLDPALVDDYLIDSQPFSGLGLD